jgi:antitoxin (DNA-binding transcriptional repressor) of toxin-antitoxin stability system
MDTCAISVTEASRNFSDCVNRARYQGTSFILLKGGLAVARIEPARQNPTYGSELAEALGKALAGFHVGEKEATFWLHDLEQAQAHGLMQPHVNSWHF